MQTNDWSGRDFNYFNWVTFKVQAVDSIERLFKLRPEISFQSERVRRVGEISELSRFKLDEPRARVYNNIILFLIFGPRVLPILVIVGAREVRCPATNYILSRVPRAAGSRKGRSVTQQIFDIDSAGSIQRRSNSFGYSARGNCEIYQYSRRLPGCIAPSVSRY